MGGAGPVRKQLLKKKYLAIILCWISRPNTLINVLIQPSPQPQPQPQYQLPPSLAEFHILSLQSENRDGEGRVKIAQSRLIFVIYV